MSLLQSRLFDEQVVARFQRSRCFIRQQDVCSTADEQAPLIPCLIEPFSGRRRLVGRHDAFDPDGPDRQQLIETLCIKPIRDVNEQAAGRHRLDFPIYPHGRSIFHPTIRNVIVVTILPLRAVFFGITMVAHFYST
jgi:hypothetical protein